MSGVRGARGPAAAPRTVRLALAGAPLGEVALGLPRAHQRKNISCCARCDVKMD